MFNTRRESRAGRRKAVSRVAPELAQGAAVGATSMSGLALWNAAPEAGLLLAAIGGTVAGAIGALMVWMGSADLPSDPIPPIPSGQSTPLRDE